MTDSPQSEGVWKEIGALQQTASTLHTIPCYIAVFSSAHQPQLPAVNQHRDWLEKGTRTQADAGKLIQPAL